MARIGTPAEEHILKTLSAFEPMALKEYAAEAGIQTSAAFERLKRLWDRKAIYIHHWEHGPAGPLVPYYAIGCLPDAPKIERRCKSESARNFRRKLAANDPGRLKQYAKNSQKARDQRYATDPEYAAKIRTYKAEWARKKFGHKPMSMRRTDQMAEIAMQIGSTWFFEQRKWKKAA